MVPTSMTLNDLEPKNRHFSEFSGSNRHSFLITMWRHSALWRTMLSMLVARSFYGSHAKQHFKTLKHSIKNKKINKLTTQSRIFYRTLC